MAGRGNPTFLKRQKEQKRLAQANAKRALRQARRDNRARAKEGDGLGDGLSDGLGDENSVPTDEQDSPLEIDRSD